ncbi:MAG: gluconokinase [Actinomycetia bacterium]|nr:gluconokinase [Actinomycetes bacterium]
MEQPKTIIIMGVSGSGKTTVGRELAEKLGYTFYDCDDLHSVANINKMRNGVPLSDVDRASWLVSIRGLIAKTQASGENTILACSALKERYRLTMIDDDHRPTFVYLRGSEELIRSRLAGRRNHFMQETLLRSQFDDLEEPHDAITIEIDRSVQETVREIIEQTGCQP